MYLHLNYITYLGGATVMVSMLRGFLASQATAAKHSMGFPAVDISGEGFCLSVGSMCGWMWGGG